MSYPQAVTLALGSVWIALGWCHTAISSPQIRPEAHTRQPDARARLDRHSAYAFLDGVGAVWPEDFDHGAAPLNASTGFLLDRCHVLTNLHAVYPEDLVVNPPVGKRVAFGVGQTDGDARRGAARGLRFLFHGSVVAHGDTHIVDHVVQQPEDDWALVHLDTGADPVIPALAIVAISPRQLQPGTPVATAGFPVDHRALRPDGFNFKDLWGSAGELVTVASTSNAGAMVESTLQTTFGMSGGPLYLIDPTTNRVAAVAPAAVAVIGMVQGFRGNGIDVSAQMPSAQLVFTPALAARIGSAVTRTPCQ